MTAKSHTNSGNTVVKAGDGFLVWIDSSGETPRCGSGGRLVIAVPGRRYVRVRPAAKPWQHPDRVPVADFERIVRRDRAVQRKGERS